MVKIWIRYARISRRTISVFGRCVVTQCSRELSEDTKQFACLARSGKSVEVVSAMKYQSYRIGQAIPIIKFVLFA